MNKVFMIGNLTRDPEMRSTQNGVSVCNFSIAVNRRYKDANGNQQTDFFNVVAWRQLADICSRYLAKGRKVAVSGHVETGTYEDKNGSKRISFTIVADEVEFFGSSQGNADANEAAYVRQERAAIQNEQHIGGAGSVSGYGGGSYHTAVNKPAQTPADSGFTQVEDDELPF